MRAWQLTAFRGSYRRKCHAATRDERCGCQAYDTRRVLAFPGCIKAPLLKPKGRAGDHFASIFTLMMVSLVPFSLILLASSVLGLTSSYARELATSLRHQHRSGPAQLVSGHKATRPAPLATADEVYTGNWAGAVYSSPNVRH
jgi:hypothetical protein